METRLWIPDLDEDTLFQCFDYYLYGVERSNKSRYKLRHRLIRHLTGLLFATRSPLVGPFDLADTPLRSDCYSHGSVRLWASAYPDTPIAKHWYQSDKEGMREEALHYLCKHWEYGYVETPLVLCHLFSDVFLTEAWFNSQNVRLAGCPGLNYEEYTDKQPLRIVYKDNVEKYCLMLDRDMTPVKPEFAPSSVNPENRVEIVEGKYALRIVDERRRLNREIFCFIPPTAEGDTAHYAYAEEFGLENQSQYMIYPPEFRHELRLKITHSLFLFTISTRNEYTLVAKHAGDNPANFIFTLRYAYMVKALALIDAPNAAEAEKLMIISRRLNRDY